jgi:gliding motility-associated-like protein
MKKLVLLQLALLTTITTTFAQLTVGTGMTAQQYVENILIGSGVTVSNVTFSGQASQLGSFNGTASNIGFNGGIALSSGSVNSLPGNASTDPGGTTEQFNGPGDPDLLQVAQSVSTNPNASLISDMNDAAILEFDFIPSSNTVNFNFVFGSDEYLTFVNSQFNDAFGFFVSGPGITGPYSSPPGFPGGAANLAVVPGTSLPITISTIYPDFNAQYYVSNAGGTTHTLNGFTVAIPVTFTVQCNETYHFKFAVADAQDTYLNTAVFLEENSFTSPPVNFEITGPEGGNGITTLVEGCDAPATVWFTRSECQASLPITVNYTVSGSAAQGSDYPALTNPISLAAGQDSASVQILALADNLNEGTEYVVISYSYQNENGVTVTTQGTLAITDPVALTANAGPDTTIHCEGDSLDLTVTASGAPGEILTYLWSTGETTPMINTGPLDNGTYEYIVTVTNQCGNSITDTVVVTQLQTLAIDTVLIFDATGCGNPDGAVSAVVTGETGVIDYNWSGNGFDFDASVLQNIPAGTYTFTASDDVCTVDTSVVVNQDPPPTAVITPSTTSGCSPVSVTFENESQNAFGYQWQLGNGNVVNTDEMTSQSGTYTENTTVTLIAYAENPTCNDTAEVTITILVCGCMDPAALNYNPLAQVDDNSCVYEIPPYPTVEAPNVFTPDGDGINDFFELRTTNATAIDISILNRWGNEVYAGSGLNPKWDGKFNGAQMEDGVYFYTYKVSGASGDTLEGHGFVHLVRD